MNKYIARVLLTLIAICIVANILALIFAASGFWGLILFFVSIASGFAVAEFIAYLIDKAI